MTRRRRHGGRGGQKSRTDRGAYRLGWHVHKKRARSKNFGLEHPILARNWKMAKSQENEVIPEKQKRGQPAFKPTSKHRNDVMLFKAAGLSEEAIAASLKISQNTLRKYFAVELEMARGVQRAKNLRRMVKAADKGSVSAQKALHVLFDKGAQEELAREDFGAEKAAPVTAAEKVRSRITKKELVEQDAINAGVGTEWESDLSPPPGTRAS